MKVNERTGKYRAELKNKSKELGRIKIGREIISGDLEFHKKFIYLYLLHSYLFSSHVGLKPEDTPPKLALALELIAEPHVRKESRY